MGKPIVEQTKEVRQEQAAIAAEFGRLRDRMMRAGLLLTFHAMQDAQLVLGYEMAALQLGQWPDQVLKDLDKVLPWRQVHGL